MGMIILAARIFVHSVVIPFNFGAFITGSVSVTGTSSDNLRFDCYELLSSSWIIFVSPFSLSEIFHPQVQRKSMAADHSN